MKEHPYQFIAAIVLGVSIMNAASAKPGMGLFMFAGGIITGAVMMGAFALWRWVRARRARSN